MTRCIGRAMLALLMLLGAFAAGPARAASVPWYGYKGEKLRLSFWSAAPGKATISWRAVGPNGLPGGKAGSKRLELKRGMNGTELEVGRAGGHRITLKRSTGRPLQIWANRGVFAVGLPGLKTKRERGGKVPTRFAAASDIQLGRAFRATVERVVKAGTQLAVERSFGYPKGQGVRPPRGAALVLVAKATGIMPVKLSLAQRRGGKLDYFDYFLVLEPKMRRYAIPLAAFRARTPRARAIAAINSIAITAEKPAKQGDAVTLGFFGLGRLGPRLRRITVKGDKVQLLAAASRSATAYHALRSGGPARKAPLRGGRALLSAGDPLRVWVCQPFRAASASGAPAIEACDPPDAPHSHYAAVGPGALVDDFVAPASVNALRQPLTRFASSYKLRTAMSLSRRGGKLGWRVVLPRKEDYAGFHSDLGGPAWSRVGVGDALNLRLRSELPPRALTVQLTNRAGKAARINLGHYLNAVDSKRFKQVAIPVAAFVAAYRSAGHRGRLGSPTRLTLVASGVSRPRGALVELDVIRFGPAAGPTVVATFDSRDRGLNALGAGISKEATKGAKLTLGWDQPGKHGRALKVTVSEVTPPEGYAILILGLGRLDVRRHKALSFWIRGATGSEQLRVVLGAGRRKRAEANLSDYGGLGKDWRRVVIPLSTFGKLPLARLQQLVFSWDRRPIGSESIWLDAIRFE